MIDFQSFMDWQAEDDENRSVRIEIDKYRKPRVWVYDSKLMTGQSVKNVSEIDLVAERKRDLERTLRELEALDKK